MNGWGAYLFPAFILMVIAWAGASTLVVLSRSLHDRRREPVRAAQRNLRTLLSGPLDHDLALLDSGLASTSSAVIEEIAADSLTPKWQAEILAQYLLRRSGAQQLVHEASSAAVSGHRLGGKRRRIAALRILSLANDSNALPLLDQAIHDSDSDIVGAAVTALGGIGDESAAHILIDALRSRLYPPSRIATQLDRFSEPIAHLILPLLLHPIPIVRFWGATLLARYPGNAKVNAGLVTLRGDPDPGVRKAVVETLGKVGGFQSSETAIILIKDPVWFVRAHAARALGDLGRVDLAGLVTPLLADPEWWVRTAAKDALEAMGPDVAEPVIPSLSSPDTFARNGAAEVLQNLGILDALIVETLQTAEETPERVDLIGKILAAGGPALARIAVARADPAMTKSTRRLIKKAKARDRLVG